MDDGILNSVVMEAFREEYKGKLPELKAKRAELVAAALENRQVVSVNLGSGTSYSTEANAKVSDLLQIVQRLISEEEGSPFSGDVQGNGVQFFRRPFGT